jgi:hypothetical protein
MEVGTQGVLVVITCVVTIYFISGGNPMQCPKCKGRMFSEKYYDFVRSFDAWKCTCCGELLDPTIMVNRTKSLNMLCV